MKNNLTNNIKLDQNIDIEKLKKNKLKEFLSNSPFIDELKKNNIDENVLKNNISAFIDYFEQFKVCKNCNNVVNCPFEQHLLERVILENDEIKKEYEICEKYKKTYFAKEQSIICDLDENYLLTNIKDIDQHACRSSYVTDIIKHLIDFQKPYFAFIKGKKNSGCTYLTAFHYKELLAKKRCKGAFCDSLKLYNDLTSVMFVNKDLFNNKLNKLLNVDVLVLNKISSVNFNEYTRDNILYPIIEQRISKKLTTIVTSELELDDFLSLLKFKNNVRQKQISELFEENFCIYNVSLNVKIY